MQRIHDPLEESRKKPRELLQVETQHRHRRDGGMPFRPTTVNPLTAQALREVASGDIEVL